MAATLESLTATIGLIGGYTNSADLETVRAAINYTNSPTAYSNGTGSNQINAVFTDTRTLAATNESFDLDGGAITDKFGNALAFAKIKLIYIKNRSTTTAQTLTITGDFLSQATVGAIAAGGLIIGPGGHWFLENPIDGYTVTAATGDVITVTNAASFTYDIVLMGTI